MEECLSGPVRLRFDGKVLDKVRILLQRCKAIEAEPKEIKITEFPVVKA